METIQLTMAQAIIKFLKVQQIERDGIEGQFFAGCFGIFRARQRGGKSARLFSKILIFAITRHATNRRWCTRRLHLPK